MKYVLHIGMNKTGTSTLQVYLGQHRDELLKHGIWYPNIGHYDNAHHGVAEAIRKDGDFAKFGIDPAALKTPNIPAGVTAVLLSSENFHTLRKKMAGVVALFPPEQTEVILYLREHIAYFASWYQQDIQASRGQITCSFYENALLRGYPYMDLIRLWQDAYGKNLQVRAYDRKLLLGGDIVQDFFSAAFNMAPPVARTLEDSNPSISGNLLFLKLVLNHLLTTEENSKVVEELNALARLDPRFSGRMRVSKHDASRLAFQYREDRKQLKQKFGIAFRPPVDGVEGNLVPDFSTLRDDVTKILKEAKSRGFAFYDIFARKRALMFPEILESG
jgi:hypothetical protein